MRRFADLFVAICIPIVSVSAGAVAHWQFATSATTTVAIAAGVLLVLAALQWGLRRRARRDADRESLEFLSRRLAQLAGDNEAMERRLRALEDGGGRRHREELDQVVAEIEVIGTLTRQVIEAVADLEVQFTEARSAVIRGGGATTAIEATAAEPARAAPRAGPRSPLVPERFAHLDEDGFLALVRRAVDAERIDVHLQPIVSLPQRKVRFYEALTRLRGEDGEPIHPSDYIPIAESRGYMAAIDEQILLKSVAILRRLAERSREVGVFLNLSAASLGHPGFFREFLQFMETNRDLADMLVLEFPQGAVRAMGPIENEGMRALKELGFRFSIDQMSDLKISFQNLADRGFRWAKISADRLLNRSEELGTDIHPVDLTDYFRRFGMELIADHIERETEVVDVLDYGVRLGQGFLFAPPRPVRIDSSNIERPSGALAQAAAAARTAAAARPAAEARTVTETRPAAEARPAPEPRPAVEPAAAPMPRPQPAVPARPATAARPAPAPAPAPRKPAPRAEADEAPRPGIRIIPATGTGPTRS
ncbi:EAL domain-containing protein [Pinisolibacter sp. B13]|uniref:EAL domain-containing protein n=1 Tax=Pinisolibacter aquiterrae TaxID=2815579 RepID=UPI001C3D073F|nr:EAL domain-containing protein [Pinisolibacter aquiterrae]MBV5266641.1 EAL domain-containing protein [Pinisolibacter aquiterrae]